MAPPPKSEWPASGADYGGPNCPPAQTNFGALKALRDKWDDEGELSGVPTGDELIRKLEERFDLAIRWADPGEMKK